MLIGNIVHTVLAELNGSHFFCQSMNIFFCNLQIIVFYNSVFDQLPFQVEHKIIEIRINLLVSHFFVGCFDPASQKSFGQIEFNFIDQGIAAVDRKFIIARIHKVFLDLRFYFCPEFFFSGDPGFFAVNFSKEVLCQLRFFETEYFFNGKAEIS